MRSIFLLLGLLGSASMIQAQQARVVVQHAGTVQVFSDLTAAITAAPNNADLYLSGGSFVLPSGFALSKTLHFVGAGIHADSTNTTGATIITSVDAASMRLASAASGTSFTGIRFNMSGNVAVQLGISDVDQTVVSVEFSRCLFEQEVIVGVEEPSASSAAFTECIFHQRLLGVDGAAAQLTRCILDYQAGTGAEVSGFDGGGLVILNCVGLGTRIGNSTGATISNSIFTRTSAPFWQSGGAILTNNLLVSTTLVSNMTGFTESGNILAVPVVNIFVSENDATYQFSDDLRLQATSQGVGAGTDGTDMGIYGTSSPYKDGSAPNTPHFRRVDVARATDASGDLPVDVRVAAEPN